MLWTVFIVHNVSNYINAQKLLETIDLYIIL